MNKLVLLIFLLFMSDSLVIEYCRKFLLGFILIKHNKKSALAIHKSKKLKERILLDYIDFFVNNHKLVYRLVKYIYLLQIITILPIYFILGILYFTFTINIEVILGILSLVKLAIFCFIRLQFDSSRSLKYINRRSGF